MMGKVIGKNLVAPLLREIHIQSRHHPDLCLREFYKAYLTLCRKNSAFPRLLQKVIRQRPELNEKHLTNLLYRAWQYLLLFKKKDGQFPFFRKGEWRKSLAELYQTPSYWQSYQRLLAEETTQSTLYQRYAGPKAALVVLFGKKPLRVLDLGCGLNLGLPGLQHDFPFLPIQDHTPGKSFTRLLRARVDFASAWAVDKIRPEEKKKWALACGLYPGEAAKLPEMERLCDFLWHHSPVKFTLANLLFLARHFRKLKLKALDAVVISTVFYQLRDRERQVAFEQIRQVLKRDGMLLINDFLEIESNQLNFAVDWFKKGESAYRTVVLRKEEVSFSRPFEFLRWDNGRCRAVWPGRDFAVMLKLGRNFSQRG